MNFGDGTLTRIEFGANDLLYIKWCCYILSGAAVNCLGLQLTIRSYLRLHKIQAREIEQDR